jgi:hypothetical protein
VETVFGGVVEKRLGGVRDASRLGSCAIIDCLVIGPNSITLAAR